MDSVGEYITRLIQQQVETANGFIKDSSISLEFSVHEVRKSMKRSRAYLQLLQPVICGKLYYEVKNKFRGVTKVLAEYRKHCVYVETLNLVEKKIKEVTANHIYEAMLSFLNANRNNVFSNVKSINNGFAVVSNQLEQIPLDAVFKKSQKLSWKQTGYIINKTWLRFQKNMLTDKTINSSGFSHKWRKCLKRYIYQAQAVSAFNKYTPIIPLKEMEYIGKLLGYDHDIAELLESFDEVEYPESVTKHLPEIIDILNQQMMNHRLNSVNITNELTNKCL